MRRFLIVLALMLVLPAIAAAQEGQYVYAVKYVCGYNASNVGEYPTGKPAGEPPVKFGNYATEINILNANDFPVEVEKEFYLLSQKTDVIAREPRQVRATGFDGIGLKERHATVDDCNRIWERLLGFPVPIPYPITIGWVVLRSNEPLEVTAVYTAEICTDFRALGGPVGACRSVTPDGEPGANGAGLSIDVETIQGRFVQF